jgi:hypothetical protein
MIIQRNNIFKKSNFYHLQKRTFVRIINLGGDCMVGNCTFAPDINQCQYFIAHKEGCSNPNRGCSFFRELGQEKENTYTREPKWFEKYYS